MKQTSFKLYSIISLLACLAILAGSKVAFSQEYFTVEVKGKGKPMLLIHGLYCNGEVWEETVERYQNEYECHLITLAGFGGNPGKLSENFLAKVKDDIVLYTKNKKLKHPVIMGHSMGGFLSFWAAASAPGLFSKVIAVDGVPYLPVLQIPTVTAEGAKAIGTNMKNMLINQTPEQAQINLKQILATMITSHERIEQVATIGKRADLATQGQVLYDMFANDLRENVATIDCPVLLLGAWIGYKNYGVTHDSAEAGYKAQVAKIKKATVEISDTAKHFIFYDDPTWFFNKVDNFLKI